MKLISVIIKENKKTALMSAVFYCIEKVESYSSMRISSILIAETGMRVPGPKIAATPAL